MSHKITPQLSYVHCNLQRLNYTSKQRGSALVIAVFVIIVMSLLGAALVKMLESSQENVAYEVIGTRAYTAAQIGVQWQLSQVFPLAVIGAEAQALQCSDIDFNEKPQISNVTGLKDCEIVLNPATACVDILHQNTRYYTITSTGQCNIDGEITSRTVRVDAKSL